MDSELEEWTVGLNSGQWSGQLSGLLEWRVDSGHDEWTVGLKSGQRSGQ